MVHFENPGRLRRRFQGVFKAFRRRFEGVLKAFWRRFQGVLEAFWRRFRRECVKKRRKNAAGIDKFLKESRKNAAAIENSVAKMDFGQIKVCVVRIHLRATATKFFV